MSQDLLTEMHGDIKVIKEQVQGLVGAVEAQSKRISPIEDDYKFRAKLYKMMLGGSGIIGFTVLLAQLLKKQIGS